MNSEDQIFRAIDKIYDAALDPTQWTNLLREIGLLVGAPAGEPDVVFPLARQDDGLRVWPKRGGNRTL
jgi:hypothetical protein